MNTHRDGTADSSNRTVGMHRYSVCL